MHQSKQASNKITMNVIFINIENIIHYKLQTIKKHYDLKSWSTKRTMKKIKQKDIKK